MNIHHLTYLSILIFFLNLCITGCDSTDVSSYDTVKIKFEQKESLNADPVAELGTIDLDISDAVSLNKMSKKTLSIDSTSAIQFRTWRKFDDNTNWKLFILIKHPDSWYYGYPIWPSVTLMYGDTTPQPFDGDIYAFFLGNLHELPPNPIPLYIETDSGVDSMMIDPNVNIVPQSSIQYTNRSIMPEMQDRPYLFIEASVKRPISRDYIPILTHNPYGGGGPGDTATFELYDRTNYTIGTLPKDGIAKDYEAFMFILKR